MPSRKLSTTQFACAALFLALPAFSTSSGLSIRTVAELRQVVDDVAGTATFVPAERLRVGDEIFYTVEVQNPSSAELREVFVVRPVPSNTLYVRDSAVGPGCTITLSTDGGTSFRPEREFEAGAVFTHIRWQLRHPLAPGAVALLRFRSIFK